MATSNIRSTRKLKQWMIEKVDSGKFPGLVWEPGSDRTKFRIPWKHGGKQDFRPDEDAALFKEWAVFKNKYKDGAKLEAAVWKTRLRCALNKSPEFAEVPELAQLDISEPYKVYQLVPPGEQTGKEVTSGKKRTLKEDDRNVSSEDEIAPKKRSRPNHSTKVVINEGESRASSLFYPDDSDVGSSSDRDTPLRCSGSPLESIDSTTWSLEIPEYSHEVILALPEVEAYETPAMQEASTMRVTIYYSGQQVLQKDIHTSDCKISSSPPKSVQLCNEMEHICFPSADTIMDFEKRYNTQKLLTSLDKGIMLASIKQSIYVHSYCSVRVFWTGPLSPEAGGCNLLNEKNLVLLFDANRFHTELELYQNSQGLPPKYQVTLCFEEEITENDLKANKLIIIQLEQKHAQQQVLQDMCENITNTIFFTDPESSIELEQKHAQQQVLQDMCENITNTIFYTDPES